MLGVPIDFSRKKTSLFRSPSVLSALLGLAVPSLKSLGNRTLPHSRDSAAVLLPKGGFASSNLRLHVCILCLQAKISLGWHRQVKAKPKGENCFSLFAKKERKSMCVLYIPNFFFII